MSLFSEKVVWCPTWSKNLGQSLTHTFTVIISINNSLSQTIVYPSDLLHYWSEDSKSNLEISGDTILLFGKKNWWGRGSLPCLKFMVVNLLSTAKDLRKWPPEVVILKVRDFQKKIGIIYRFKQICHFTILNSSFEFSRVFYYIEQNVISKIQV